MKKRLLECPIHGLTLFRCKRRCWTVAKDKPYTSSHSETCFKCIAEGRIQKVVAPEKRKVKTISLRR